MNEKYTEATSTNNEVMNLEATLYHYHAPNLVNQETSTEEKTAS